MSVGIWDRRGPIAGSYWPAVAMVVSALTPFLILSSALPLLGDLVGPDVGLNSAGLEMSAGMANAAYCFGTVLAIQLVTRLPGRRLLLAYAFVFMIASVMTAVASSPGIFFAGRILQGLMTGLMLITAAPLVVLGFPTPRLRSTAVVMNLGIFGAVALGPVVGGAFAELDSWRPLFWLFSGVGALALALAILTFEDRPPQDPSVPVDPVSLALASGGCVSAFFGASGLVDHSLTDPIVLVPMLAGLAMLTALIVHQSTTRDPLMPIRQLGTTIPVAAILLAMFAGAGSVALVGLMQLTIEFRDLSTGLFWPEFGGAIVTAFVFGRLFFSRYVAVMALSGLLILIATAIMLIGLDAAPAAVIATGALGLGLGVGSSVAPALFVTGFSLPSPELPRIFALVELLRGVAAFLTAPIIIHFAVNYGAQPADGLTAATLLVIGILALGIVLVAATLLSGGARLQEPEIDRWLAAEDTAIHSPPLGDSVRRRRDQAAARV